MARSRLVAAPRIIDAQKARKRRALDARFERNMGALHEQLDRGRQDGETLEQLGERLVTQLEKLLHRVARRQVDISFEVKRPRGRPKDDPQLCELPSPKRRSGAPVKFTLEWEQEWVITIDRLQAQAAAAGHTIGDERALRLHMRKLSREAFIKAGEPPRQAARLAEEQAHEQERSPEFPAIMKRRKQHLSRARGRARQTRR